MPRRLLKPILVYHVGHRLDFLLDKKNLPPLPKGALRPKGFTRLAKAHTYIHLESCIIIIITTHKRFGESSAACISTIKAINNYPKATHRANMRSCNLCPNLVSSAFLVPLPVHSFATAGKKPHRKKTRTHTRRREREAHAKFVPGSSFTSARLLSSLRVHHLG